MMKHEVPGAQAAYQPLAAFRDDGPGDHRDTLLGGACDGRAGELRERVALAIAASIAAIREHPSSWPVFDVRTREWRDPRMADITILVPTRTSLRQLEDALDARAIPFRVATGTLVYDTQEVRDALAALRAVDDPGDAIALVSALRSPMYACSDADLFTFFAAGGKWDLRHPMPVSLDGDHPVVRALAHLHTLWEARWWSQPSALLERLLRERSAFALAFAHRRPREVWRRFRFLVDQARAFEEAGGGGLRAFLDWAELQRNEGSRVHEPLLGDTDDDAVSILTIHGSKGLEFPITVVSGVTTEVRNQQRGVAVFWEHDKPEIRLRKGVGTTNFDRLADFESEMDVYERQRLLYVACTRARDHLIVSTFHRAAKSSFGEWLATLSAPVEASLCRRLELGDEQPAPPTEAAAAATATTAATSPAVAPVVDDDRATWVAARAALLERERVPRFVSATGVAQSAAAANSRIDIDDGSVAGEDDDFDDTEGRAGARWRRGRAGTAIGRAVHATLQLCSTSATVDQLEALAEQQAHVEAIPDLAGTVAALARSALDAPCVRSAHAASRSWRELYVAAPLGDRAVEGYVDLLYETDNGLVLVDYKTDGVASEADIDAKVDQYRLQLATYAVALETTTGLEVVDARLVFCNVRGAVERSVPDLAAAKAAVQQQLHAGV
jgi:ATP-dependent exoDNAse (exonuclease V) beta subunit